VVATTKYPSSLVTTTELPELGDSLFQITTLDGDLTDSVTTVTVVSTSNFPSAGFIVIDEEAIIYTGTTATTFTGCTRASFGTSAASHAGRADVYCGPIPRILDQISKEIIAIEAALGTNPTVTSFPISQVAHGITLESTWLAHNGTIWVKADADNALPARAITKQVIDVDNLIAVSNGLVALTHTESVGDIWLSTAGTATSTEPVTAGGISQYLGYVPDANSILVNIELPWSEL
jgi:hypothetical protein